MSESHPARWARLLSGYGLPLFACVGAVATAILVSLEREHTLAARNIAIAVALISLLTALFQHFRDVKGDHQLEQLKKLAEENAELSEALKRAFTGGDSFLMAYLPFADGKHWFTLRHFGKETLRDIRVRPFEFKVDGRGALQVNFQAPNGWWAETVIFTRVEGELLFALRAWRMDWRDDGTSERTILREEIHPKFPRGPFGEIDWSVANPIDVSNLVASTEPVEVSIARQLGMQ